MSLLEEVYEVNAAILETFLIFQEELDSGGVSPETEALIADLIERRDEVLTALGNWYMRTEAEFDAAEAKYKPIQDRIRAELDFYQSRLAFIRWTIERVLPKQLDSQLANDAVYIHYRRGASCEITNAEAIPLEYTKEVHEWVPEKKRILEDLEKGLDIPGAQLKESWNPQIKPGGPKAMENAKKRLQKLEKEKF